MKKLLKKAKKGFTLVELVVVIAIIAILSGVSVAVYVGITNNAKQSAANSDTNTIGTVVRAAVLMNPDGYSFNDVGVAEGVLGTASTDKKTFTAAKATDPAASKITSADIRVYIDADGMKVAISDLKKPEGSTVAVGDLVANEAMLIKMIYKDVEKKDLTGDLGGDGLFDMEIKSFTYSPNKDSFKGTYTF